MVCMPEPLPPPQLLSAFLLASLILAVTPGPGVLYIVTRSLAQGRRSGIASVLGVAAGNLGNAIGASLGLAALFAASAAAFTVVKYAGAACLVYLGVKALLEPVREARGPGASDACEDQPARGDTGGLTGEPRLARVFRDGLFVALLNPKTAIFFAAFLPQFMGAAAGSMLASVLLGAIFVAMAATTDTVYALTAGSLGKALSRNRRFRTAGRYASGGAFIGLGLFTALSGTRTAK